eukprot:Pgem_evm2s5589
MKIYSHYSHNNSDLVSLGLVPVFLTAKYIFNHPKLSSQLLDDNIIEFIFDKCYHICPKAIITLLEFAIKEKEFDPSSFKNIAFFVSCILGDKDTVEMLINDVRVNINQDKENIDILFECLLAYHNRLDILINPCLK